MNPILDSLIERFRSAQDIAVTTLTGKLNIPRPSSGVDWVLYCCKNGLQKVDKLEDVGIYAHGYGIELKIDELTIDFDWGDNGEPDGFDGWRLWCFARDNFDRPSFTHADINEWLDHAYDKEQLTRIGSLYFDPNRRAGKQNTRETAG